MPAILAFLAVGACFAALYFWQAKASTTVYVLLCSTAAIFAVGDAVLWRRFRVQTDRALALHDQQERSIKPYIRYEITTSVASDGAIAIERRAWRPVSTGDDCWFMFESETTSQEVHPADEDTAVITERVEQLRQVADADTAQERERYEEIADRQQAVQLAADEARALRPASEALSMQLNARLRERQEPN